MKKVILSVIFVVMGVFAGLSQSVKYQSSIPENNSEISSLDELTLQFDFSEIYTSLGGTENDWGVCANSFAYTEHYPDKEKTITLYEGTPDDGVVLERIAETIKPPHEKFRTGNSITFNFSKIEIKPQQVYTVVVKYIFYAGKSDATTWTTSTKQDFSKDPLVLTFIGGAETQKVLKLEQTLTDLSATYEQVPQLKLGFNYGVKILPNAKSTLTENGIVIGESSNIALDPDDNKNVLITFPETTLYNGHVYECTIPENIIAIDGEESILNSEISLQVKGASFRSFGIGRVFPSNNSTAIPDQVIVPFKFPVIEGSNWSYGFVNNEKLTYPMSVYKGTEEDGELVATVNGSPDNASLTFNLTGLEPGTKYTCVIAEGTVKAYAIGDPRNSYLKDYISEKVVLTYTTPTLESLPELVLPQSDIQDGSSLEFVESVTIANANYLCNGTYYLLGVAPSVSFMTAGVLYEVLSDGSEKEVKRFEVNKSDRDVVVLRVNEPLYNGKNYRIVIPAGTLTALQSNFLTQFVGNKVFSLCVVGAKSTESASEFTSGIVEGQKLSHVGVVSFYTDGEVTATENAVLELRKGEETVVSAPVRVAKEEGYSHVYADFSGETHKPFATENGTTYTAVLPKGAVVETANENLLNKEQSVTFTGVDSEAVCHNVTLSLDNAVAQTSAVEEGKTVSFVLTPADELWKVESVSNATLDAESGKYVTEPVNADIEVKAVFALVNPVDFDFTEGVDATVAGCPYSVYSENGRLVISGVAEGDNIRIYTTGGALMAERVVPSKADTVSIDLTAGIYIVAINSKTLKVKH